MLRNLGPFTKPEHEVFWRSPHEEGVSQKRDRSSSSKVDKGGNEDAIPAEHVVSRKQAPE